MYELYQKEGMGYDFNYGVSVIEVARFDIQRNGNGDVRLTVQNKAGKTEEVVIHPRTVSE